MNVGPAQGRRGRRFRPMAEINVTPFVDVMLVLLIIFMVVASELVDVPGEEVNLPKTDSDSLQIEDDPLTVTVTAEGEIFVMDQPVELDALTVRLEAIAENGFEERIYLRADEVSTWDQVMQVMSRMKNAGFTNIGLVTDPVDE